MTFAPDMAPRLAYMVFELTHTDIRLLLEVSMDMVGLVTVAADNAVADDHVLVETSYLLYCRALLASVYIKYILPDVSLTAEIWEEFPAEPAAARPYSTM